MRHLLFCAVQVALVLAFNDHGENSLVGLRENEYHDEHDPVKVIDAANCPLRIV